MVEKVQYRNSFSASAAAQLKHRFFRRLEVSAGFAILAGYEILQARLNINFDEPNKPLLLACCPVWALEATAGCFYNAGDPFNLPGHQSFADLYTDTIPRTRSLYM